MPDSNLMSDAIVEGWGAVCLCLRLSLMRWVHSSVKECFTADRACWCLQSVKEHLRGYEKGLADAETTPRTKEAEMAVVQAKLRGYSEVETSAHMMNSQR